ncbi:hypothetical protein N7539_003652 [Penicillium diatomitis]|uniref:Uncharacterized protein n=1 Tax=Penicillium diatomitis TaxID=2819901 RepID=A0A9W9XCJ2_9EURO|nr:uncharacterized protein N7539_003652 [Penicillium diatomitis]KAJ5488762.1 hypothetical protein N7539_003652 [Penicillium diatomitis]
MVRITTNSQPEWPSVPEAAEINAAEARDAIRRHIFLCQGISQTARERYQGFLPMRDVLHFSRWTENVLWQVFPHVGVAGDISSAANTPWGWIPSDEPASSQEDMPGGNDHTGLTSDSELCHDSEATESEMRDPNVDDVARSSRSCSSASDYSPDGKIKCEEAVGSFRTKAPDTPGLLEAIPARDPRYAGDDDRDQPIREPSQPCLPLPQQYSQPDESQHILRLKWNRTVAFPRPGRINVDKVIRQICLGLGVGVKSIKIMARQFTADLHVQTTEDRATLLATKTEWLRHLSLEGFEAQVDEAAKSTPLRVRKKAERSEFGFRIHWVCTCPPYKDSSHADPSSITKDVRKALAASGKPLLSLAACDVDSVQVRRSGDVWVFASSSSFRDLMVRPENASAWLPCLECGHRAQIYTHRVPSSRSRETAVQRSIVNVDARRQKRREKRRLARTQKR